jgi:hypothetical protein
MQVSSNTQTWQSILQAIPDTARPVLETFAATGLADANQVQQFTNLTRDRVARALERLLSGQLLDGWKRPLPRPDQRGKPASVYLLTKEGAEVLRSIGVKEARPCGLKDDLALLHRLAMTDLHLAAAKAGVPIRTDQLLRFNGRELRPDHLLTLADGRSIMFEVEQAASTETLRRVVESLQNKRDFFTSNPGNLLPEIRMVLQLPRGTKWDQTLRTWEKAMSVVQERAGGPLGFRLFAIPRREFLQTPDWGEERHLMWLELSPTNKETAIQIAQPPAPKALLSRTPREDWLVLNALWQDFRENVQTPQGQFPRPNTDFFRTLRLIHAASHDQALSDLEQAAMPYASIYLLGQYLSMRNLRPALNKAIHNGKGNLRWNPTTILHRMQVVINTFLGLHGWRSDGALFVMASMSDWQDASTRTFGVDVRIRKPSLLMVEDDLVVPNRTEVEQTERALAWALWALFAYSLDLGLGRVEFW